MMAWINIGQIVSSVRNAPVELFVKLCLSAASLPLTSTRISDPDRKPGSSDCESIVKGSNSARYTSLRPPLLPPGIRPSLAIIETRWALVPWAIVWGISAGLTHPRPSILAVTLTEWPCDALTLRTISVYSYGLSIVRTRVM